jgi:hypothetical protein
MFPLMQMVQKNNLIALLRSSFGRELGVSQVVYQGKN